MAISKVVVVDGNNLIVRIDRGVAGRGVTDVQPVEIDNALYLEFFFSDGTTETVGPVGTIQYIGQSPIVVNASTISLSTVPVNLGGTNATTAADARTNLNAANQATTISAGTGLSGGGDLSANRTISLANTTVTAAAYGSASKTLTATVNAQGQLTALADINIAIANTQVSGLGTASTLNAGVALGVATLDAGGTVPLSQIPASIQGGVSYQGTWNATTNTPTLTSGVGSKGYYYVVSVAGSTNLNGVTTWNIGDWAIFNGTAWEKIDNTDAVTSVNGYTGTVVLTNTDITGFGTMSTQNANSVSITGGSISGITDLAIADGGTGQSTANAAFNALAPSQTGNTGKYLTTNGTDTSWATNPLGTVTSVDVSGGTTGLTTSGGPVTTSGTITLAGTLAVANGGTGVTTSTGTGSVVLNTSPLLLTPTLSGATVDNAAPYLNFTPTTAPAYLEGRLFYDSTAHALTYYNDNSQMSLNIGQENVVRVRNQTGASIADGTVVYVNGATGNTPTVALALANAFTTSDIIGVTTTSIANNGFGYVTISGLVNGLDTSLFTEGQAVFVSATTPGAFTATEPVAPNYSVQVGVILRASPSVGTLLVAVQAISVEVSHIVGTIPIAQGGTGQTTANAALNALLPTQTSNANKYLQTNGTNTSWDSISLSTSDITGTLGTTNGGTGLTSFTANGVVYASSTSALATGSALTFDGSSLAVTLGSTTTPSVRLYYNGASQYGLHSMNANGDYVVESPTLNGVTSGQLYLKGNAAMLFGAGGTEQMRLTSTGLGIGTSSPAAKFESVQATSGAGGWYMAGQLTAANYPMLRFAATTPGKYASIGNNADGGLHLFVNGTSSAVGTEAAILDSAGNLGLGVTPSASPNCVNLELPNGSTLSARTAAPQFAMMNNAVGDWYAAKYKTSAVATMYLLAGGQHQWYTAPSGTAGNAITFSQVMTLDASGNLGIGTTSPSQKLNVNGIALFEGSAQGNIIIQKTGTNGFSLFSDAAGTLGFYDQAGGATRLRIDSAGNLGLGVTPSAWGSDNIGFEINTGTALSGYYASGTTAYALWGNAVVSSGSAKYKVNGRAFQQTWDSFSGVTSWNIAPSGTAGNAISFTQAMSLLANGTLCVNTTSSAPGSGAIQITPKNDVGLGADAAAAYYSVANYFNSSFAGGLYVTSGVTTLITSSDYRLKNITGPITTSGAYIDSLKPVEGTWKADGSVFVGLIAHEVQEVSKTLVATGTKDGEKMQGMTYSSPEMIANLIAEVKSLRQRVATLEAQ